MHEVWHSKISPNTDVAVQYKIGPYMHSDISFRNKAGIAFSPYADYHTMQDSTQCLAAAHKTKPNQ